MGMPSNRRERRAAMRGEDKKRNNRRSVAGRFIQLAPNYTQEEIDSAGSSIEMARRCRSMRNIQHYN